MITQLQFNFEGLKSSTLLSVNIYQYSKGLEYIDSSERLHSKLIHS